VETLIWFLAAGALVFVTVGMGLAVAALIHRDGMSPGEDLMVAFGGGIAVTALGAVAQLPLPFAYTAVSPPLMIALLAVSAVVLWRRRVWLRALAADPEVRLMGTATGVLFAIALTVGALPWDKQSVVGAAGVWSVHVPNMPGDTLLQYRTAQVLQNRLPIQSTPFYINYWYISDRTPLVGFMTTFLTAAAGIALPKDLEALSSPYQLVDPFGYWLYRQISMLTNAMVVASAVIVAWRLLGARAAKLGAVFVLLSPFILINVLFHWPKLLAGFFIAGFYFWSYIRGRPVLAGIFAAGAVLSHPVGALYIPSMFIYLLTVRRWRQLFTSGLTAAAVAFPWFFWTSVIYHHTSRMLTYPIGYAIEDPTNPGPGIKAAWQAFIHRSPLSLLTARWELFRFAYLGWTFPSQFLAATSLRGLGAPVYEFMRVTFPGIFGVGLALFGYLSLRRIFTQPFWVATIGGSTLFLFLFWGIPSDALTISAFQPMAGLLICLAAAVIANIPKWLIRLATVVTVIEWIGFTYLLVLHVPEVATWRASTVIALVLSLALVAATGVIGWRAADPRADQPTVTPTPATSELTSIKAS
jgi:hypothetical protein